LRSGEYGNRNEKWEYKLFYHQNSIQTKTSNKKPFTILVHTLEQIHCKALTKTSKNITSSSITKKKQIKYLNFKLNRTGQAANTFPKISIYLLERPTHMGWAAILGLGSLVV
jgi:hypothetical protein